MKILDVEVFDIENFPYRKIRKIKPCKRRGKQSRYSRKYADIVTAFDIETTRLVEIEQSIMYIWQWAFDGIGVVIGRTWDEFLSFRERIEIELNDMRLVVWVHNLSYEFQFLAGIHYFQIDDVFAVKSRKVLRADMGLLEFRCSYLHSNMTLAEYTNKMQVKHCKLAGELDYKIRRFPWTELAQRELQYCINDVVGLCEAIINEMRYDGDTLNTIPLTSTGYVRRDVRNAMKVIPRAYIQSLQPNLQVYELLRETFRGGDTHANRYYSDRIIENYTIHSFDRSSSYPDVICNCMFPITPFRCVKDISNENFYKLLNVRKRALLFRAELRNVKLKDEFFGAPYLAKAKCGKKSIIRGMYDNGRILSAERLVLVLTDVDFRIIEMQYDFELFVLDLWYSRYGYLPQPIRDMNIEYYRKKTELKGVEGQEIYYMKSKNKLNSIYGMFAQDPVKFMMLFVGGTDFLLDTSKGKKELLEENRRKAFICYAWGVWVTAWARYRLQEGIQLVGDGFIYCDTDSVKYIGDACWDEYNQQRIADSLKSGAYATDPKGNVHYMGVFEKEQDMRRFKTMGAKKYVYEDADGKLHITIAGVNKKIGARELLEHGGIEAFNEGFIFHEAGGLEAVYNDIEQPYDYAVEGRTIKITRNTVLRDSTYTIGLTQEYRDLLSFCAQKGIDSVLDL